MLGPIVQDKKTKKKPYQINIVCWPYRRIEYSCMFWMYTLADFTISVEIFTCIQM